MLRRSGLRGVSRQWQKMSSSSNASGRQIVRDPRIKAQTKTLQKQQLAVINPENTKNEVSAQQNGMFHNNDHPHQSLASSLGSYIVLGVGVSLGFAIVGLIFGG
mmetsp:Transcript_16510/g.23547  ORF Transcript_16510/g.23547 Transcript_16510/m.23547 type:complete len:104 (-) Transcript_16510:694-1005(-)